MIEVTVWGSRGSIPVSGSQFHRHGGATTCLELHLLDAAGETPARILMDCGTGMTELGKEWNTRGPEALVLQTHMHWDHIQGFPFFQPLFNPKNAFHFWATPRDGVEFQQVLSQQMSRPSFPVGLDILPSALTFHNIPHEGESSVGEATIRWTEMWHPSGSTAFRIDYKGASVVFSGDVELQQDDDGRQRLVDMAKGADLLLMDAQYMADEYPTRKGFGHSTPEDAIELALEAGVRHLLLTHHDPSHDDNKLDTKLAAARKHAAGRILVDNAHDRLRLQVPAHQHSLAVA